MNRTVILGGGVGGTLVANLLARRLRARIDRGEAEVIVVDAEGAHVYQPGFMYIAMGGEREEHLRKAERSLLDRRVRLEDGERLAYDELVIATGARIVPEAIAHFDTEAHQFYTAAGARKLRAALDHFEGGRVVIGIASMPYKCPPA